MNVSRSRYSYLSFMLLGAFFIFRIVFIAITEYDLIADEAYFWDWSRHLSYGYYDMGPMVAWIIGFFTYLLPVSEFSVRLGAPIFAAFTSVIIYLLARDITRSEKKAFIVILLYMITPVSTVYGVIMTYYTPQIFFMALTAYFLWMLISEDRGVWLYAIGASLGLGMLSHHMFVFFSAEVGLFIVLSGKHRKWLRSKELYVALAIEILLASPLLIWNLTNDLVVAKHAVGLMHRKTEFIKTFSGYIGGQAGVHTPLLFLAIIYSIFVSGYRGIKLRDDPHLFLFCLSAPVILFVGVLAFGGRTEPNWPVTGYITGTISAVVIISEIYDRRAKILRKLIKVSFVFTLVLSLTILVFASFPSFIGNTLGITLPPKSDPANRLYGWSELGREVSIHLDTLPEGSFVTTNSSYGLNAQLAFYVDGNPEIYAIPVGRRASQYDLWNPAIPVKGRAAIFVDRWPVGDSIKELFEKMELASHLVIRNDHGEIRREFYIYKAFGYKGTEDELSRY
ncbi:MAG: glycosyltransferase family 39 protein [Nitrospirota bacterium]|nr:MAG: glycosyltransferase family 39 protein [Nitrospirota bacterium]